MSHSTHVGFNEPPGAATSFRFGLCHSKALMISVRFAPNDLSPLHGLGVGIMLRCAGHFCIEGESMFAFAVGVGNRAI